MMSVFLQLDDFRKSKIRRFHSTSFNPWYRRNFSVGIFQDLSTLTDFNWIVSMVKSDLMNTYTIADSSYWWKSKWALVHLCTCKAAANRSNVYVSGKNNKILPFPETMHGISTSMESKEERSKKNKKKNSRLRFWEWYQIRR